MSKSKPVPLMLSIPKSFRDKLRRMAAEQNLKNPDLVTSASTSSREIVCEYLALERGLKFKESEGGHKNEQ